MCTLPKAQSVGLNVYILSWLRVLRSPSSVWVIPVSVSVQGRGQVPALARVRAVSPDAGVFWLAVVGTLQSSVCVLPPKPVATGYPERLLFPRLWPGLFAVLWVPGMVGRILYPPESTVPEPQSTRSSDTEGIWARSRSEAEDAFVK